ncbi:MAG: restriction endonuclease subunit S [Lewinellaceae bacterium]|nr:restriction endonuclease subunit S [Lewinellaceae bacterium]
MGGEEVGGILRASQRAKISKSEIEDNGVLECITYGELYTTYGELINKVQSHKLTGKRDLVLSNANDVIIPASGETHLDIATASCVLKRGVALGGDLNIIRSKTDGVFLAYYLNNAKKRNIAGLAQGSSVVHLYSSQLKLLDIHLPSLSEQQKIANFLTAIDQKTNLITIQIDKTKTYKKGLLQQLFV